MTNELPEILITREPLRIASKPLSPEAGAVVEFLGVVRETEDGAPIEGIEYDAHVEMARHQIQLLAAQARERFGLEGMALCHRIGFVPVAEPSLWVRVSARHRGEAFAACQWMIERLKEVAPIWKRPVRSGESREVSGAGTELLNTCHSPLDHRPLPIETPKAP